MQARLARAGDKQVTHWRGRALLLVVATIWFWFVWSAVAAASDGCATHTFIAAEGDGFEVDGFIPNGAAVTSFRTETTEAWDAGALNVGVTIDATGNYLGYTDLHAEAYEFSPVNTFATGDAVFTVDAESTTGITTFELCYVLPAVSSSSGGEGSLGELSTLVHGWAAASIVLGVLVLVPLYVGLVLSWWRGARS